MGIVCLFFDGCMISQLHHHELQQQESLEILRFKGDLTYIKYLSLTGLLTAIRGLNIYSHLYLRVLSPPGPYQALTINFNNQII